MEDDNESGWLVRVTSTQYPSGKTRFDLYAVVVATADDAIELVRSQVRLSDDQHVAIHKSVSANFARECGAETGRAVKINRKFAT